MARLLLVVVLAAGIAGGSIGWLCFAPPEDSAAKEVAASGADPVHRFQLTPADMNARMERPTVAVDALGRLLVAWASGSTDTERTLYLARSTDGGNTFEPPAAFRTVPVLRFKGAMRGKEVMRGTNLLPRLAVSGHTIFLAWTEPVAGQVELLVARSNDGGKTFSTPLKAHGTNAQRPTFTALTSGPEGSIACSWLDHRNGCQQPFCVAFEPGGKCFEPERMVFAGPGGKGICPCCDTDVLQTADGTTFIAFRNNDDDVREMHVSRRCPGAAEFEAPVPVSDNRWKFAGCPHDGPVLAVHGDCLHVVWMDAHSGRQRVYYGRSEMARLGFTSGPLDTNAPGNQGHPRLVAGDGRLHAVWDGSLADEPPPATGERKGHHHGPPTGAGRAVMYASSADNGKQFGAPRALAPRPGAFQLNPAIAAGPNGAVFVVWNELREEGKSVGFMRVPAAAAQ